MEFAWQDYDPKTMGFVESWLDESAVKATGLDEGFRDFYEYWVKEDGYHLGENFWCKVVFQKEQPFGIVAFGKDERRVIIMELVIAPKKRGQGLGGKLLQELLAGEEIIGFAIEQAEAVIFPSNIASQRAFEKAGFRYHHAHEDGDAFYYVYESQ